MDFFQAILQFTLQALVVLVVILLAVAGIAAGKKRSQTDQKKLIIESLNERFNKHHIELLENIDKKRAKKLKKSFKKIKPLKKTLFVIDFNGDVNASAVTSFRELVSIILLTANPDIDQVLIRLESGGGAVHQYGLAAAQCERFKKARIHVTIAVDRVAASGGYMMACTANQIIAAEFAIVGSIGVIFQLPNINKLLGKNHIEIEQLTAGNEKRNLTLLGKNSQKDREFCQTQIDEVHQLFQSFIHKHRPAVNIEQASSGRYWYASQALELKLIDQLTTSDEWLLTKINDFQCQQLSFSIKQSWMQKLLKQSCKLVSTLRQSCEQLFHQPIS